jgi:hypothetical protein
MLTGMLLNDIHDPSSIITIINIDPCKNDLDIVPAKTKIRSLWHIMLTFDRQMAGKSYSGLAQPTNHAASAAVSLNA